MNSNNNLLESLTEQQQTQVYELMGIADIEDANTAAKVYIDAGFDLNRALQRWFDRQAGGRNVEHQTTQDILSNNPSGNLRNPLLQPQNQAMSESELHTQYRRYLERRTREEEEKGFTGFLTDKIGGLFSVVSSLFYWFVPVFIRGEREGGEQFYRYVWRNYPNVAGNIRFNYGTFQENATRSVEARRPYLVFLHIDDEEHKAIPGNLMAHEPLTNFINNKFHVLGLLANSGEGQQMTRYVETKDWPFIGVFRVNLVGEPILLESIPLKRETTPESVLAHLRDSESNYFLILGEEENIKRDVQRTLNDQRRRNMHMSAPLSYSAQFLDEDENQGFIRQGRPNNQMRNSVQNERIQEDRILRQIQEEEFKEVERKILEQQQKKDEDERMKRENAEKEAILKLQKEEETRRKVEEKELTKKTKLQSLPDEPSADDKDAILIIFRLPNGDRLERRFRAEDKAQVLYDYIDSKDVHFDPTTKRYDLMQPRPFLCLEEMTKPIGEYFEGSNHEVITIREHAE